MRRSLSYIAAGLFSFNLYSQEAGIIKSSEKPGNLEKTVSESKLSSKILSGVTVQPALIAEKESKPQESWGNKLKGLFSVDPYDIEEKESRQQVDAGKLINYLENEAPLISKHLGEAIRSTREVVGAAGDKIKYGVDKILPFGFKSDLKTQGGTIQIYFIKEF